MSGRTNPRLKTWFARAWCWRCKVVLQLFQSKGSEANYLECPTCWRSYPVGSRGDLPLKGAVTGTPRVKDAPGNRG